ncbi:MAG TPA: Uma2 family endonuclease [Thermomicrobiales bacterium]
MVQQLTSPRLLPGHTYPMSLEEYRNLGDIEGLQVEWVDGEAIVFMSVLKRHALMTAFLVRLFGGFVDLFDLGDIFSEQFGMLVPTRPSVRLPDMFIVLKEHRDRVEREWFVGGADFVAEVGSEDSLTRDRRDKYLEFQAAGSREYLWVEGREGHTGFDFFRLDHAGSYQPVQPDEQGRYHSEVLPGFWFDPAWLEQDPLPNPLHLLKLIAPDAWRRFLAGEPLA